MLIMIQSFSITRKNGMLAMSSFVNYLANHIPNLVVTLSIHLTCI